MPEEKDTNQTENPEVGEGLSGDEVPPEEEAPPYLREELPSGKADQVKWYLLRGKTKGELIEMGFNPGTIRVCISNLKSAGLLKEEPKPSKEKKLPTAIARTETGRIEVFARGSPPEALINALDVPDIDGQLVGFEKGMKFGANLVVLGVRVAQELSTVGIQQAKPIMEMAKNMREGEALAAKSAASEAAIMAAGQVERDVAPYLEAMSKSSGGPNPMQAMMVRMFEPVVMNVISKFVPGMAKPLVEGWKKRVE